LSWLHYLRGAAAASIELSTLEARQCEWSSNCSADFWDCSCSPQLLSTIGPIDNTPLDFHRGKLDDYTLEGKCRMREKTGMTEAEITRAIERYVVWPGQATSYKVGQIAILRLWEEAERVLGDRFDLRAFHDVVLGSGALPLELLEWLVRDWIQAQALR